MLDYYFLPNGFPFVHASLRDCVGAPRLRASVEFLCPLLLPYSLSTRVQLQAKVETHLIRIALYIIIPRDNVYDILDLSKFSPRDLEGGAPITTVAGILLH